MADTNIGKTFPRNNLDLVSQEKNPSKALSSKQSLTKNFDDFLLLLTTQLKNQDPTAPLDTNEFTQQLVQFSSVEQAVNTNSNLEKLINIVSGSQVNTAVGYIGKIVDAEGNSSTLSGGKAQFAYNLPEGAVNVNVSIADSTGQVVFNGVGDKKAGKNLVVWDGVNSFTGATMPPGTYKISVVAKDAQGANMEGVTTYSSGVVTSVDIKDGQAVVSFGNGFSAPLEKIFSVREVPPATPAKTGAAA